MSGLRRGVVAVHGLWRPGGAGCRPRALRSAVAVALTLLGLDVAFAVLLDLRSARVATDLVSVAAQFAAAAACFWTARWVGGAERRWRVLVGLTATGAMLASLAIVPTLLAGDLPHRQGMSPGYAVFLSLYGVALAGLLSVPTDPVDDRGGSAGGRRRGVYRWYAITLLDCLLIAGSLVLLQWGTVLSAVVQTGPDIRPFRLALTHQGAGLILATAVVLIASFRRPRAPATLALLGTGLLAYGLTTNIISYVAAEHGFHLPPWGLIGFAFAFLLIFLAAFVPVPTRTPSEGPAPPSPRVMWAHAALPYAALTAAGLLILGKLATGARLDWFETYGMITLLVLALLRQMVTLAENTRLLAEIRERERQLHHQAFHDPLTGLANRALFTRRLQRALTQGTDSDATNAPADGTVSVLFLDLDGFKRVNDAFGHAIGDELLQISADRLRAETRAIDTVARLGGDEFGVILDGGGPDDPRRIGERLATAIQAPCLLAGRPYTPHASLGLVTLDSAAHRPATPDILIHQADLAMYAAKREQAGGLVIYEPEIPTPTHRPGRPGQS
ncbi:GGDEF domain-containing protein [Parafrankia elaeagni]|uniref:GGDEF domain-containing protein n=1 Tax=Parafrankia elaeagni TaxID=222534 RepID=UPI000477FA6A|nr:GGDEF domain-containing protein [Parafrankia elaeagni]